MIGGTDFSLCYFDASNEVSTTCMGRWILRPNPPVSV